MQLYDDPTVVGQDPGVPAAGPNGPGYITDGVPGSQPATTIRGWWLNGIAKEIVAVIAAAGIAPTRNVFNQLLAAIQELIATAISGLSLGSASTHPATDFQAAGDYLTAGEAAGGDLAGDYPNPTIGPSVALRGSPTTTTQAPGDDSSKVATTAYTDAAIAAIKAAFNSATDGFDLPGYSQRVGSLIAPAGISTATLGRGMPTTILFVQACPSTSGSPPPQISAYITPASPSATQFFINNASSGPVAVDYVAYGH